MSLSVEQASSARQERLLSEEIDKRVDLLLANYERVTADPKKMAHLKPLLKHYARSPTPFRDCAKDGMHRWGPGRTEKICAVLKDTIRQGVSWRGHPALDHGAPGVAIAEASGHGLSEDQLREAFGVIEELGERCDVYRVLIGLDEPPVFGEKAVA